MRLTALLFVGILGLVSSGDVSAQSAFLDDGQDGTAIGFFYTSQNRVKGYGFATSFSANGQTDINVSVAAIDGIGRSSIFVFGLGATPYLRTNTPGGVSALFGLPVGVSFSSQSESSHSAMVGIASEVALPVGHRARLVLSGGLSYILLFDSASNNTTVWSVGIGQSIPAGTLLFVLGVSVSQSTDSNSDAQLAFHLDFLFPR